MCAIYVELLCAVRFGLSWAHDSFFCLHITWSSIFMHMYLHFSIFLYIDVFGAFLRVSLSPSLFLSVSCIMAPKRKSTQSQNPLRSGASSSSNLAPSHVWFHDDKAQKDFLENFCRRGIHSECQVILSDFLILTYPLSFTIGVGGHYVTFRSLVPPCLYKSFTPICMESILLYLISSLMFEVRA